MNVVVVMIIIIIIINRGDTEVIFDKIYMDHGDFWNNLFQVKNKKFIYRNGSISRGEDTSLTFNIGTGSIAKFIDTNIYYGSSHSMNDKFFIVSSQGSDLEFSKCIFINKRMRIGCKDGSLYSYFSGKVSIVDCKFHDEILSVSRNFFIFQQVVTFKIISNYYLINFVEL